MYRLAHAILGEAHAAAGHVDEARIILEQFATRVEATLCLAVYSEQNLAALNEKNQALHCLEVA